MNISEFVASSRYLTDCLWQNMTWDRHLCGLMKFGPHAYGPFYDRILSPLREKDIVMVEIGISGGWSLMLWDLYFKHPNTQIIGIDPLYEKPKDGFNENETNKATRRIKMYNDLRAEYSSRVEGNLIDAYTPWCVDQFEDASLDIVLDDGSHYAKDKLFVVEEYWSKVKSGGWLIIEDYHANADQEVLEAALNTERVSTSIVFQGLVEHEKVFPVPTPEGLICLQKE